VLKNGASGRDPALHFIRTPLRLSAIFGRFKYLIARARSAPHSRDLCALNFLADKMAPSAMTH
jgi:hypothetical protein